MCLQSICPKRLNSSLLSNKEPEGRERIWGRTDSSCLEAVSACRSFKPLLRNLPNKAHLFIYLEDLFRRSLTLGVSE